jgi:signal transduction histidine kinase
MENKEAKQKNRPVIAPEDKARFEEARLETNVNRMLGFAIYVAGLQIVLQIANALSAQGSGDGMQIPLALYIALSLATLLLGIVYWVLLALAKNHKIKGRRSRAFLVNSLLYLYYLIQMAFCTFNILSHQGINGQLILILLFGLVPILKPLQSAVSILSSFAYTLLLLLFTQGITDAAGVSAWQKFFETDMRAYFFIVNGLTILISVFIYRLYVSNFAKSIELEHNNANLELAVRERTRELEEKTLAAEAASSAKSRFLTNISHEIRTPLNAISGMAYAAKTAKNKEKIDASVDEISSASAHLIGIMNDILDMSNIETGKMRIENERFLLRRALEETVSIIETRCAEKAITFTARMDGVPDIAVNGDKLRLKQVLLNLLGNAVQYTREDGKIALKAELTDETAEDIGLDFSVADSGVGMSEEQLERIFVAFEQGTTRNTKNIGAGLGLAISQSLVGMMGGTISAQSRLGQGSVFTFSLRFKRAAAAQKTTAVTIPNLAGKHILSVEDIAINRIVLTELLAETHAQIDEAVDGLDAVEKFKASPEGYYSLVFMDLLMPNMSGFDATRAIRGLNREDASTVPIVALSANAYPEDIDKSLRFGMNAHIAKPVDFWVLMRELAGRIQ